MRPRQAWLSAVKHAWFVEFGGTGHLLAKHPENLPSPRECRYLPCEPPGVIMAADDRLMATAGRTPQGRGASDEWAIMLGMNVR